MKTLTMHAESSLIAAVTAQQLPQEAHVIQRARNFAEPFIANRTLDTGENILTHADAVAAILESIDGSEPMQAASYLVYACSYFSKPEDTIANAFGPSYATLAMQTNQLIHIQRQTRVLPNSAGQQTENVRKMLLAFSQDLRVVMLRLASRLQTLRYYAGQKIEAPHDLAYESLHIFAPLANRLGIWQIKWEMEDLSLRFLEPKIYKEVARLLDTKREQRELQVEAFRSHLQQTLNAQGIKAEVQGRPKHIYSIVKKMRGKSLHFDQVLDIRAMRVVVPDIDTCYATLAYVHEHYAPALDEFDDYIAKPKPNGYQSLHTIVREKHADGHLGAPIEIQIRTHAMHDHAENGVAAHWAYKEAGTKGYVGVSAPNTYDTKIAVLRQLLAWERDISSGHEGHEDDAAPATDPTNHKALEERIYVLTPDAKIIDLPQGSTPIDFAYAVHTSVGHRCRGARVDDAIAPLNTELKNGQTVDITTVKEGGPSRDWLNQDLGFVASPRAKAKVRAWFNAQAAAETVAKGREAVAKLLQREGKTSIKLDELASQLGFKGADALFEVVGKDEFSLHSIEALLNPIEPVAPEDNLPTTKKFLRTPAPGTGKGDVLVVGVDSLVTQLAKCCRPAPPDAIKGFVTRGKGISIHRAECSNMVALENRQSDRIIEVQWQDGNQNQQAYAVDISLQAQDRPGLLRDIFDVLTQEKIHVIEVNTQSNKSLATMTFTVEIANASQLSKVLLRVSGIEGVQNVQRR